MNILLRRAILIFFSYSLLGLCTEAMPAAIEKPIVIVIPSYNNEEWYMANLNSVFRQKYSNYRVIYINDCSTDNTYELVRGYIDYHNVGDRVAVINNRKNVGALANLYNAIHYCLDHEIIVTLDGDDALVGDYTLTKVNEAYADSSVWMAYTQFVIWPSKTQGWNSLCSKESIDNAIDRGTSPSHLRTFYAGLFKKIELDDLLYEGDFFSMSWDMAMMLPMMEMARDGHIKYIEELLYVYNDGNPISDHRKNREFQRRLDLFIRGKRRYQAIKTLF